MAHTRTTRVLFSIKANTNTKEYRTADSLSYWTTSRESVFSERYWERTMGIAAAIGVLSPFPFYYWLWTSPQSWVALCGKGRDPCKVMAYVFHFLKLIQFLSLFSVSTISWPPPLYFWPLIVFGQFLNFRSVSLCRYVLHSCLYSFDCCDVGN